jgi:flavin-dependent dehydrogenase
MRLGHVVVVGGGIAGLVTARVLAEHASSVTIVERDRFPDGPEARKGVPQARHLHALLQRGYDTMDRLVPDLVPALDRAGAVSIDWCRDTKLMLADGWYPRYESGLLGRFCSRALLEHTLRDQVARSPRIAFQVATEATGVFAAGGPGPVRVGGVTVRPRAAGTLGLQAALPADLVVDAAGRDSHLPEWLAQLGIDPPPVTTVDAHLGYSSRLYEQPAREFDWRYLLVRSPGQQTRAGGISPMEGGRWLVTLAGFGHDYPPRDDDEFVAFADSLRVAEFGEALAAARPLTSVVTFRRTVNRHRHLERVTPWPAGLIAVGDSVCTFNPIYGQGMSVACLGAELLGRVLAGADSHSFEGEFQRRLGRLVRDPWAMATGEDYRYPETEGPPRGPLTKAAHWYAQQVTRAAVSDVRVHRAFIEAIHMLRRPATLARPDLAARVLVAGVRRGLSEGERRTSR